MKHKVKIKAEHDLHEKKPKTKVHPVWEMSAQAALRVDYLSHHRRL